MRCVYARSSEQALVCSLGSYHCMIPHQGQSFTFLTRLGRRDTARAIGLRYDPRDGYRLSDAGAEDGCRCHTRIPGESGVWPELTAWHPILAVAGASRQRRPEAVDPLSRPALGVLVGCWL